MNKYDYITATNLEEKVRLEKLIKYMEDNNIEDMFVNVSSNYLSKVDFGSGKKSSGFTSDKAVSISNSLSNGFNHVSNGKTITIKKKKFVCC